MLLMYSGGIAALSSNNYSTLSTLLMTKLRGNTSGQESQVAVVSTIEEILEVDRLELFKRLPGYESFYAPRSEYLFKALQPELEDLLFLGNSYEDLFDRFEIFYALVYADESNRSAEHIWGPPGRFGWKGHLGSSSPFQALLQEAKQQGSSWSPLSAGLFRGSATRFEVIAEAFRDRVLSQLQWF